MAFTPAFTPRGVQFVPRQTVRMSIASKSQIQSPQIIIGFSRLMMEAMGWQAHDRVLVNLGTGADLGRIHMRKIASKSGKRICTTISKNRFQIAVTVPREIGDMTREAYIEAMLPGSGEMDFEIVDGELRARAAIRQTERPALAVV